MRWNNPYATNWPHTVWASSSLSHLLAEAIRHNDVSAIERALVLGVPVDIRIDNVGHTMLHLTAVASNAGIMKLLISQGAEVDAKSLSLSTPLITAARSALSTDTMEILLDHGADINAWDCVHETALMEAISGSNAESKVMYLLSRGAEARYSPLARHDALRIAARRGILSCFKAIAESYGNVWVEERGTDVIIKAAEENQVTILDYVIEHGVDVDSRTLLGSTPLMHAAAEGKSEAVIHLLDAGADPSLRDWRGATAWRHAMMKREVDMLRLLHERGAVRK